MDQLIISIYKAILPGFQRHLCFSVLGEDNFNKRLNEMLVELEEKSVSSNK